MLVVASIFRNAESYVPRYLEQIDQLRAELPLRLVIAEGDSDDDTLTLLERGITDADTLLKVDHGGPEFGSVDNIMRWAQIAYVYNTVLDHTQMADTDRFLLVESDLAWEASELRTLVDALDNVSAVAAMSLTPDGRFYDTWGHVGLDGKRFTANPPHHKSIQNLKPGAMTAIESAGSCIAVRGDVMNAGVRFANVDGIRGFCRTIRDHATLWLHTGVSVWHGVGASDDDR